MKKYLFTLFLFYFFSFSKAQRLIGIKPGLSFGFIYTSKTDRGFIFNQTWPGVGISLIGEYRFFKKFGFQLGGSYLQKNYYISRNPYTSYYINTFLEFPFQFKFFPFQKKDLSPFLALGGYMGYWTWAFQKGKRKVIFESSQYPYHKYSQAYKIDSKKDIRFDVGILASLGVEYQFRNHHVFFFENQYSLGFRDTEKKYPLKPFRANRVLVFYLGYLYKL